MGVAAYANTPRPLDRYPDYVYYTATIYCVPPARGMVRKGGEGSGRDTRSAMCTLTCLTSLASHPTREPAVPLMRSNVGPWTNEPTERRRVW